jgi:energy-coupling factor transporter ATP-binding protein EcfA2
MTNDAPHWVDAAGPVEVNADWQTDLLRQTALDKNTPFQQEWLERLASLKREDFAVFRAFRDKLKKAGCGVTALDTALARSDRDREHPDVARILEIAEAAESFRTPDGKVHADVTVNGHRETWPVKAAGFRDWLQARFYEKTGGAPHPQALASALETIEAKARYGSSREREVHLRVARHGEALYLDLADDEWRAVEIDANGWRVTPEPAVRFRRPEGMEALPQPETGGSIDDLRQFLNVESEHDFVLAVAWLLSCLFDRGPFPVLVLYGEQGSAKSTVSKVLRGLVDPHKAALRTLPSDDRDLFIAATNGRVLAFDNVSKLSDPQSDALCRLATGGSYATRRLYTDGEEAILTAKCPLLLNGIDTFATRGDLADRSVFLHLKRIPDDRRRTEGALWSEYHLRRPRILGALLEAVATGLAKLPTTKLTTHPRMADFAQWATACEGAHWPAGTFMEAHTRNRHDTSADVLEADPVASAVLKFMTAEQAAGHSEWKGTATELHRRLAETGGEGAAKARAWPADGRALSKSLNRAETVLRQAGIKVDRHRATDHNRTRLVTLEWMDPRAEVD